MSHLDLEEEVTVEVTLLEMITEDLEILTREEVEIDMMIDLQEDTQFQCEVEMIEDQIEEMMVEEMIEDLLMMIEGLNQDMMIEEVEIQEDLEVTLREDINFGDKLVEANGFCFRCFRFSGKRNSIIL